ncbi:UDP-N-acetylmuramoylalanyl-D-glutamate--2,6-diaminopimelate ligase [Natranaerovirga pectinivora]|uniref:UDP-N-acetylmuramyl-tripeptide synthetase n=1 Tax=Natranaerovirga pectinivora TaxID=682400 RepID=A0A4R3MKK3_9FIRM|nr:UDP-N-acetylmuramoyl-L-alanyl-D-glutamate--2,6-diaminopimelate ligase [Natranaerovirga pectinivora]TCT12962.1 UDP-N-acetylmuramoylalanyl-D-glutamate--2,6-diaminopimelate ligase [Natranaerovirga pectinivora]
MLLTAVIKDLDILSIKGNVNIEISKIAYDSREVVENGVFVAISGFKVDGHNYIQKAIDKGAKVIILENEVDIDEGITVIKVEDSRLALAKVSTNYYNHPTQKFNLVGITGTNGKTSVTYFIKAIYDYMNKPTSIIGTIGTVINNQVIPNKNTTPESLNLNAIFNDMVNAKVENCIMEVSSHALNLNRVGYCDFNTGIFTNLSPDHLELHNTMEEYFNAKAKLFHMTSDYNIINMDDEYGKRLIQRVKDNDAKVITYGLEKEADIYAKDIICGDEFTKYTVVTPNGTMDITVNIPGIIYVYNSLAAIAYGYCNNIGLMDIQQGINSLKGITGRLEVIYNDDDYKVIVDFAHTEDGLEKALNTIRPFVKGRIILVFGVYAAAGEKGRDKRVGMGKIAAKYSDVAVVTSDNPKDQDPELIIQEIVEAIQEEKGNYKAIIDRREAINYAIEISRKDDVILLTGKGHETSQIIGTEEIPFNEKEIVNEIINNMKNIKIG